MNTTWFGGLKTLREGAANPISGLNAILGSVLTDSQYYPHGMTIDDVIALNTDRQNGADISGTLSALSLESNAFDRLVRVCSFVKAGLSLLTWEWDEVYSILVQVGKKRAAFSWVAEELNHNVLVCPDYFTFPPNPPQLFPTDVDANGLPLGDSAADPHWTLVSTPAGPANQPVYTTTRVTFMTTTGVYSLSTEEDLERILHLSMKLLSLIKSYPSLIVQVSQSRAGQDTSILQLPPSLQRKREG